MNLLFIGIGGGLGAISRYGLTSFIDKISPTSFPLATLLVNVIGCLLVGFALGSSIQSKDSTYYFFVIGYMQFQKSFKALQRFYTDF
mgnify:CR=1 FL=1